MSTSTTHESKGDSIAAVFLPLSFGALFSLPVAFNIQVMLAIVLTITAVVITYVLTIWRRDHETP